MSVTEILETLTKLQEALKPVRRLNHGGCCVLAVMVAKKLKERGLEVEIVTPTDGDSFEYPYIPASEARELIGEIGCIPCIDDWYTAGMDFSHVAVRFMVAGVVYTYDSNYLRKDEFKFGRSSSTAHAFGTGLFVEEAEHIASVPENWNSSFNREQIPMMQAIVDSFLG